MSLRKKATVGIIWQAGNVGVKALLNVAYIMLISRLVSKESFGEFAIVAVVMVFVTIFSEVGIGSALVQRDHYNKFHLSFAHYTTIGISVFLFGILYLIAPFICQIYEDQISVDVLHFIGINLIIASFGVVSNSLLIREMNFKKIFISSITSFFIGNLVVGIWMAYNGWEVWALVMAFTVKNTLLVVINFAMVRHSLRFNFAKKEAKEIMRFGGGLTLSRIFHYIANQSDRLIIGKIASLASLGVYERVQVLVRMPNNYFGIVLNGVMFSAFSKVKNNTPKIREHFLRMLSILSLVMFYISVYAVMFSEDIITIVLGDKWESAIPVFQVMSFLIFINIFSRFSDTLIRAKDALYWSSLIKAIYCVLLISAIFVGFNRSGLIGAVYLMVIAGFINAIMMLTLSLRLIDSNWIEILKELMPSFKLGLLLAAKNITLLYLLPDAGLLVLTIAVFLDLIIAALLFRFSPTFFGKKNITFLSNMLIEVPFKFKGKGWIVNQLKKGNTD